MSSSRLKQRSLKSYTPDFRIQAVKLVRTNEKSIAQTAVDLGIPIATLHTWIKKVETGEWSIEGDNLTAVKLEKPVTDSSNSKVSSSSHKLHEQLCAEQKKNQELERQVRRLTQEREILKKAMAYCLDVPK